MDFEAERNGDKSKKVFLVARGDAGHHRFCWLLVLAARRYFTPPSLFVVASSVLRPCICARSNHAMNHGPWTTIYRTIGQSMFCIY